MGYKISQSYFKNAKDKRQALRDIFEIKDFSDFSSVVAIAKNLQNS
jgi:hypothetical protein